MIFPDMSQFDNYKSYFEEFIRVNKESEKSPMSYQFLATKLNWPRSYLNDVIMGRKNLTVTRVLEFARFAQMDVYDTEKLLYMSLKDSTNDSVGKFFDEQLSMNFNTEKPKYVNSYEVKVNAFKEIALWQYIDITNKVPKLDELKEAVVVFKDTTNEEYESLLNVLVENGAIKINHDGTGEKIKDDIFVASDIESQKILASDFAESILQFATHLTQPRANFNFMFFLTEQELTPFRAKLFKLINWVNAFVAKNQERHLDPTTRLFQFSLNFFPISKNFDLTEENEKAK